MLSRNRSARVPSLGSSMVAGTPGGYDFNHGFRSLTPGLAAAAIGLVIPPPPGLACVGVRPPNGRHFAGKGGGAPACSPRFFFGSQESGSEGEHCRSGSGVSPI